MAEQKFKIVRQTDQDILRGLAKIAEELDSSSDAKVSVRLAAAHRQQLEFNILSWKTDEQVSKLMAANSHVAHEISMMLPKISQGRVTIRRQDHFDEAEVVFNDAMPAGDAVNFLSVVHSNLGPMRHDDISKKILGDEVSTFYQQRDEALLRLEGLSQKLIEDNEAYRGRVDEERAKFETKLNTETELKRQKYQEICDNSLKELEHEKRALSERQKTLDDRDSKHARRQIRKDLKQELEDRSSTFKLTEDTNRKRWPVHAVFVFLLAFIVASAIWTYTRSTTFDTLTTIKLLLSSVALVGVSVYYIKWTDRWFREHSEEEFKLKRLALDIDRASWVVETVLEWQNEKNSSVPSQLLDRLTHGLFSNEANKQEIKHPSEDFLSALVGASKELNLKLADAGEVKLTQGGMKKLKKALASED